MSETTYIESENLVPLLPDGPGLVGFDLEADSLYRYSERICLVQVCYGDEVALIDPLAEASLDPMVEWLTDATIWMHGADYDMALMMKEWNFVPPVLLDTQIAAQLLGHERFGYASLVEQYFEVELSKSSQKADWGKRPLSETMLKYAINDVRYLLPLAAAVEKSLKELGRDEWFLESCAASRVKVINRESSEKESWRISGSGKLNPKQLSILRALWHWRDGEAAKWNRPSFMVAGNKDLIQWSEDLSSGKAPRLHPKLRPDRKQRLNSAIDVVLELSEEDWPKRPVRARRKKDPTFVARLDEVMKHRNVIAEELKIDPSVIASRPVLEQIVGKNVEPAEILLSWQQGLLNL